MSVSSFSSILSNTIISVKCINDSKWYKKQKNDYGQQLQQSKQRISFSTSGPSDSKENVSDNSANFNEKNGPNNLNPKYCSNHIIDTYA